MEVIGKNLDLAFKELEIDATKTYQEESGDWQVWEADEEAIRAIDDSKWKDEYGWYRFGGCILEGTATSTYHVNGEVMMGYPHHSVLRGESVQLHFDNYVDWFGKSTGLSKQTNMAIFAESLARDNHMKLSEFMDKYQGASTPVLQ